MTKDHLDADVVAAWADGSLDPHARAAAEAHAADCTRCQAVLAAMVRTEPEAVRPGRGWLAARWLVPLATAAVAVALWVALSMDVLAPGRAPQVLRQQDPATPDAAGARAATSPAPIAPPQPVQAAKRLEESDASTRQRGGRAEPLASSEPQRRSDKPDALAETVIVDQLRRDALTGRPPATPPSAAPSPPPASAAAAPSAPPAAKPEAAAEQAQFRAMTSVTTQSPALSTLREFASPDFSTRWRIGPGGAIHRSVDAGKIWVAQASGVTSDLMAASAPSNRVCWVVGRAGVVLLSTDGSTWRRVAFPEPVDLQGVTASDARTASVTTSDGRTFRTTDAGGSWQR